LLRERYRGGQAFYVCPRIDDLGEAAIRAELDDAFEAYRAIFRTSTRSFAAPGWRTNATALRLLDGMGLSYRSDTRGAVPYRCVVGAETLTTPEIPTTLPTLDEIINRPGLGDAASVVRHYLEQMRSDALNVHTVHAETEGMGQFEIFAALIRTLKEHGAVFVRLADAAARLDRESIPRCPVIRTTLDGRAGWISAQGPPAD